MMHEVISNTASGVYPLRAGLVSVIVPCYNIKKYVGACLESIAAQTYSDMEVLLIDDGSTDGTHDVLEKFAEPRASWRSLTQRNAGLSAARNLGLDEARGKWLIFVDGDDELAPHAVEKLVETAVATQMPLVCANHYVRSMGRDIPVSPPGDETIIYSQRDAFENVLYHRRIDVSAWGKVYARHLFQSVRFPVGRIYEDTYVFDDILSQTNGVAYIEEPLYYYVMRSGSIVNRPWAGKQLQFIDATDKFAAHAEALHPDLAAGATRRRVYARLSVLRYMNDVDAHDRRQRDEIVSFIRRNGFSVLKNKKTPMRDRFGILLASSSLPLFFCFWHAYSRIRRDR